MYNFISSKNRFPSNFNLIPKKAASSLLPPPPPLPSTVHQNVFELIGKTPMVKLNHPNKLLPDLDYKNKEILCNICVKLEYLNPGGSIKDRIGKSLMDILSESRLLKKESYILEPSSGNTGIAISMNAAKAVTENKCTGCYIVTNEKCSDEKINVMKLLGSNVCIIHEGQSEQGVIEAAINQQPRKSIVLDQFSNQVNPQTHYTQTAEEIYMDLGQKWPDLIAMGCGSGGTFTGIATRIKDETNQCRIVGAEPEAAGVFHHNPHPTPFLVEGLAGNSPPINLDKQLSDEYQTVTDKQAFLTARNLAKYEGILCGGSSGLIVAAAIKAIIGNESINIPGKVAVVILPDGIRNYMSKFVLDQWMEAHLFKPIPELKLEWYNYPIDDSNNNYFKQVINDFPANVLQFHQYTKAGDVLKALLKDKKGDVVAHIYDDKKKHDGLNRTVGLATLNSIRYYLTNPRQLPYEDYQNENKALNEPITHFMEREFLVLRLPNSPYADKPTVGLLSRILDIGPHVVIGYEQKDDETNLNYFYGKYVVSAKEVLSFRSNLPYLPY